MLKVISMLIYPWMCFPLGPKPYWTFVALPFNINNMISFFNKLLSFIYFCFYIGYFVPPWKWMVMEISICKNLPHSDKEVPWSMCYYCCIYTFWLKALHILKWLCKFRWSHDFFLPFVNYYLFMCYGKIHL
jgi:hypothetical protein